MISIQSQGGPSGGLVDLTGSSVKQYETVRLVLGKKIDMNGYECSPEWEVRSNINYHNLRNSVQIHYVCIHILYIYIFKFSQYVGLFCSSRVKTATSHMPITIIVRVMDLRVTEENISSYHVLDRHVAG